MKRFIIDQTLILASGVGLMICMPLVFDSIFTAVFDIMVATSCGYLGRHALLLPLDLLKGKITEYCYFSAQIGLIDYEFSKGKCCPEWKFRKENQTFVLVVPAATMTLQENSQEQPHIEWPMREEKIRITYYRFSKILLSYEPI